MLLSGPMNLLDLTINQLKRAAEIKQQIEDLNKELASVLSGSTKPGPAAKKTEGMSASVKKKIAAAQKARWAKLQGAKASNAFSQTGHQGQEEEYESGSQSEVVRKIESFLGREEIRQEIILRKF